MFDTKEDRKKMEDTIDRFKDEMKKVRTGRAHPDMLAGIKVEVYGKEEYEVSETVKSISASIIKKTGYK